MSLQWYPGHMTKAHRDLTRLMPSQDVVIEVLDARLPRSSSNAMLTALRGQKPCIKVLTRSDLADAAVTKAWVRHFQTQPNVTAFAARADRGDDTRRRIVELSTGKADGRGIGKSVRALVVGVPNVGKSTLINTLTNRAIAAVGNKPAVTKEQQTVTLKSGMVLTDSPGMMSPKIEDEASALRLAFAGSIPDTAIDYLTVGQFGGALLLQRYPRLLTQRYGLATVPADAEALLTEIARSRAALHPGGGWDLQKAATILTHEFRSGALGLISLEAPQG